MSSTAGKAVIDANVIILLLADEPDLREGPELHQDWLNTRRTMEWVQARCDEIVVPAPVLAELAYADMPAEAVLEAFIGAVGGQTRIEPFDQEAAAFAGEILRNLLPERRPGEKKHVMKYDVMISAIAHRISAKYLVTGDKKKNSFPRHLEILESPMTLINSRDLPPNYQTDFGAVIAGAAAGAARAR